jgi:hypothetical protein
MKHNYVSILQDIPGLCQSLQRTAIQNFFTLGGSIVDSSIAEYYAFTPVYLKLYEPISAAVHFCDLLGISILESEQPEMQNRIALLADRLSKKELETHLIYIAKVFTYAKNDIAKQLSKLKEAEIDRVNEALHCLAEGCYYSTVAMAVTAIESRLLAWMKGVKSSDSLDTLTLGQLVNKVMNEKEYADAFPEKHKPQHT